MSSKRLLSAAAEQPRYRENYRIEWFKNDNLIFFMTTEIFLEKHLYQHVIFHYFEPGLCRVAVFVIKASEMIVLEDVLKA